MYLSICCLSPSSSTATDPRPSWHPHPQNKQRQRHELQLHGRSILITSIIPPSFFVSKRQQANQQQEKMMIKKPTHVSFLFFLFSPTSSSLHTQRAADAAVTREHGKQFNQNPILHHLNPTPVSSASLMHTHQRCIRKQQDSETHF